MASLEEYSVGKRVRVTSIEPERKLKMDLSVQESFESIIGKSGTIEEVRFNQIQVKLDSGPRGGFLPSELALIS